MNKNKISIFTPFNVIFPLNPRNVSTVGDQVLIEHLYSFHSRESISDGFQPIVSKVEFDYQHKTVTFSPTHVLMQSDGSIFSMQDYCQALEATLQGSIHSPYKSVYLGIECLESSVRVNFSKIPVNLQNLFTVPDYAITHPNSKLEITSENKVTNGPYYLEKVLKNGDEIHLRRNHFYPESLIANKQENVTLNRYLLSDIDQLIQNAFPAIHSIFYFLGHSISNSQIKILKDKGYRIEVFPNEWVSYISFNSRVNLATREFIGSLIDEYRDSLSSVTPFGVFAYSIAPSDRPFGIKKNEYQSLIKVNYENSIENLSIGILKRLSGLDYFKNILNNLGEKFADIRIKYYDDLDYGLMIQESDVVVQMLGIVAADPLSHLSFLMHVNPNFKTYLSEELITRLAMIEDMQIFAEEVKKVETALVKDRKIIPIAHFPGIVARAPGFERDENLAWSWGVQAWTFKVP